MSEIAQYVVSVVVIPALIAMVIAAPFALKPLRARHRWVEAGIAFALMTAFVVSFANELGWNALVRQVVAIPNDDAPFEKWHRVGMTAAALGLAALFIPKLQGATTMHRFVRGFGLALLAAVLVGIFVRFPAPAPGWQLIVGFLVPFSILGFVFMLRGVILWAAWISYGLMGFLAAESGFASLAVMCGAMSVASFLIACVWLACGAYRRRDEQERVDESAGRFARPEALPSTGAIAIVLGTQLAVVSMCAKSYDGVKTWEFQWILAALLPLIGFALPVRRWVKKDRWFAPVLVACLLLSAAGIVGYLKWRQADAANAAPSKDQELLDMYGG